MESFKNKIRELLPAACEFQGESMRAREIAREEYRKAETQEENILRISIDGLLAKLASNMKNKIENADDKTSYQISLVTSYVRSHYIINEMILDGDIIEATTLIRKQLESLTRIHELDKNPLLKLLKKTPNVINCFKSVGKKIYPHLSEIAHFATPRVGELLHVVEDGDLVGPSLHPRYTKSAHGSFDLHALISIYFLFWLIEKQKSWFPNIDSTSNMRVLYTTFQIALESGVISDKEAA
ncbi:hypothetical protein [Diaphorobacter nitroreducens]|uniref:hypothetical protein n=1 Tax=Diaphorobacter nitroreducens TaxID=164759 RepID=UPI00289B77C9|nr:hypothetical protein [Diaphorobacter nitroreducens]